MLDIIFYIIKKRANSQENFFIVELRILETY